jgi:hypothetical protein
LLGEALGVRGSSPLGQLVEPVHHLLLVRERGPVAGMLEAGELGRRSHEGAAEALGAGGELGHAHEDGLQGGPGVLVGGGEPLHPRQELVVDQPEVGGDEVVLGAEVPVQGHLRHPGLGDDRVHPHGTVAVAVEQARGGVQDPLPGR